MNFRLEDSLLKAAELLQKGSVRQSGHPADWARERAGIKLWSKQREICTSVMENKKTAVRAGHGVGKSLCAAVLANWWIDTHPVGEAFVISTAPSTAQVHAVLWANMGSIHEKAGLAGEIQLSDNWIIGKTLVAQGRKPHDHNKHAFQGIHRKYVLVIIDEACGIPEWIWNAVETVTTGEKCRLLAIGNPDDASSHFAKVCKPGSGWNSLKISVLESPNFTGEEVEPGMAEDLPKPEWVEDKRNIWGEGSAMWDAKILGEFSENDEHAVIPWSWILAAQRRFSEWKEAGMPAQYGRKIIGADIARFGTDATCFAHRQGNLISHLEIFRKLDTEVTADMLMKRMYIHEDMAAVDVIGVGAGVVDKLRHKEYNVRPFNAASRTDATDRSGEWGFLTLRSAAWWNMRELLDPANDSEIMLPEDDKLTAELIAPKWTERIGAKIYVESKKEVRARIGRSTDRADAVIMAFWYSSAIPLDDVGAFHWTNTPMPGGAIDWVESESVLAEFGIGSDRTLSTW